MRLLHFLFTLIAVLIPWRNIEAEDTSRITNVLFIAIDDLNDWVGFLDGHPQALTPNMDRLAERGIVFTNAHCVSPACNPSRAAIFSGKMPWKTGVWSNDSKKLFAQHPNIVALPHSFRDAGYTTYGTGKLMHGGAADNRRLFQHHFNVEQRWSPFTKKQVEYTKQELPSKSTDSPQHVVRWDGPDVVLPLNGMPSDRRPNDPGGESFDWGPLDIPDSAMGDTRITDWAINKLRAESQKQNQPFFLGVGYYRPHIPLFAPAKYFERFQGNPAELPPFDKNDLDDLSETAKRWALEAITAGSHATVVEHDEWQNAVEAYLACTTFVDAQIGRLLEALDAGEMGEKTLIVLWTDHGWHLGEKQHWGKWAGWERSTRVPLVIVPPKRVAGEFAKPGSRCDEPVSLIDLYPTLMELCDLDTPEGLDGESLVSLLKNPQHETGRAIATSFDPGNVAIRDTRWRLIRYADGSRELYDLKEDPNEWNNLVTASGSHPQVQRLSQKIPTAALKNRK